MDADIYCFGSGYRSDSHVLEVIVCFESLTSLHGEPYFPAAILPHTFASLLRLARDGISIVFLSGISVIYDSSVFP